MTQEGQKTVLVVNMFHAMTYNEMEKSKPKLNSGVKLEFITDGITNS